MNKSGLVRRKFAHLQIVMLLFLVAATSAWSQQYTITDLGNLGGQLNGVNNTIAYGINKKGDVVGFSYSSFGCYLHSFLYSGNGPMFDLGSQPGFVEGCNFAVGINDAGQIAYAKDHHPGSGDYTAHRYTPGIGTLDLGALPGDFGSYSMAINTSGKVVGASVINPNNPPLDRPFLYSDGIGMQDLGNLGGGRGQAWGLNAQGIVVGWSSTPATPPNDIWDIGDAFIYVDRTFLNLNRFSRTPKWHLFVANGINDKNKIVGYGLHKRNIRAFRFNFGTTNTVKDLGTFPGGGISYAKAINKKNWIVGAAYLDPSGAGNYRAALWRPGVSGALNLNNMIPANSGWVLFQATGINNAGQIIGWGSKSGDGDLHAFRLDPI